MTDRATLAALVARVEAAMGADRELDAAIARIIGWRTPAGFYTGEGEPLGFDPCNNVAELPRYTASLDAAASLVLEGWRVRSLAYWPGLREWHTTLETMDDKRASGTAKTEPLARAAAALRAMMETMDDA